MSVADETSTEQVPISPADHRDFSLVLGGPLYRLFLRTRMVDPPVRLVHRRILAAAIITWVPLALLTAAKGDFLSGVSVSFIYDLDVHTRFLLALPMLVGAEAIAHHLICSVVEQFRALGVIDPSCRQSFEAIISRAMRLLNSVLIEVALLLIALTGGYWLWRSQVILHVSTWYGTEVNHRIAFTWAGYWYVFVSTPLFRFIVLRWYFRLFVWYVFLFRVSRLRLQLNPLHPDRAGGLGFLTLSIVALAPIMIAQTVFFAGVIGNEIWHEGMTLPKFRFLIPGFVTILTLMVLLPMGFFALQMEKAKRSALREYRLLSMEYVGDFRQKWLGMSRPRNSELLGSGDIQSLADLANGFDVVSHMRLLPFTVREFLALMIVIALPFALLTLTMIPFDFILQQLIKVVL